MTGYGPAYNEIDGYISELTDEERKELATADAAIELAFLFHGAREARGLTQAEAARQTGLHQQAVSRFEQPDMKLVNTKFETLRKYLIALGYIVGLSIKDATSGALIKEISFEPTQNVSSPAAQTAVGQPFVFDVVGKIMRPHEGYMPEATVNAMTNKEGTNLFVPGLRTMLHSNTLEVNNPGVPQYQSSSYGTGLSVFPTHSAFASATAVRDPLREDTGRETIQRGAA
jgi:transcriptional regulator with XRE-family HTH domain